MSGPDAALAHRQPLTAQYLAAENIAAYVERVVSQAPPLTPEQADRIAALLRHTAGGAE